ncbi:MAG: hypothetical protein ACPGUV_11735, partial [Polyangiales bacterium]
MWTARARRAWWLGASALLIGTLFWSDLDRAVASASRQRPRQTSPYQVVLEGAHGERLRSFVRYGKTFVLGRHGQHYRVRVYNHSPRRVEAVVSVDGRDVVSGAVADFRRQRGYLIEPYSSVRIQGFRKSYNHVASFRFTHPSASYSSRRGTPQHVGIIGVAIFPEKRRPRPLQLPDQPPVMERGSGHGSGYDAGDDAKEAPPRRARRSSARPSASPSASEAASGMADRALEGELSTRDNLGTRYGETRYSAARRVAFRRQHVHRPA